jgi:hypothetical protein
MLENLFSGLSCFALQREARVEENALLDSSEQALKKQCAKSRNAGRMIIARPRFRGGAPCAARNKLSAPAAEAPNTSRHMHFARDGTKRGGRYFAVSALYLGKSGYSLGRLGDLGFHFLHERRQELSCLQPQFFGSSYTFGLGQNLGRGFKHGEIAV